MLNKKISLIVLVLALILNTSCKKEFTTIGIGLVDKPHFEGKLYKDASVKIYDQGVSKVFSTSSKNIAGSNLPVASLGIYADPKLGHLKADIVSDIFPDVKSFKDDLGQNIKILGAQLTIPFFSHTVTDNQNTTYKLDSIYGTHSFEIKIQELTYLLTSYDPDNNLETPRYFYSDFDFSPFKSTVIADTIGFNVNADPYITYKRNEDGTFKLDDNGDKIVKDSLSPQMVIQLDTTFFRHKIFDHSGEDVLTNLQSFQDYFRGVYIEAISDNNQGLFMQLPYQKAKITLQYTRDETDDNGTPSDTSDDTIKTVYKEIVMPLGSTTVNHYENNFSSYFQNAINNSDMINGDADITLKGDAGSEAVIQLFSEQQLRDLRLSDWLINQAELYLYVDQAQTDEMLAQTQRLCLYNFDDKKNLEDLYAPENNTDNDYNYYDGKLHVDKDGNHYYKFGITRHIRDVIKNDSTNVKLGLRVCSMVVKPLKTKDLFRDPDAYNPKGVILYGNQSNNVALKPVLKIHYSQPQ